MFKKGLIDLKQTFLGWVFDVLSTILKRLPVSWGLALVGALGSAVGRLNLDQKKALLTNVKKLLAPKDLPLEKLARTVFRNFAMTLYDFFFPIGLQMEVPDRQKLERLRQPGKGLMLLTFHMGHWELGARVMSEWGWPVTAVYQPYTNKKLKEVIEKQRAPRVNFIPVGGRAAAGVRGALQRGDVVAMLGDHPFGEDGMPVTLLGHSVLWPKGPVVLAVKEMVPIVIAIIVRTAPRRYQAIIEDPLFPQSKTRSEVDRLVQEVANKFGKLLQQYPMQWYRLRPFEFVRWETLPPKSGFEINISMKHGA